jgi:hypothetical protein
MYTASTHDYLLVFTNLGKIHWLKVYEIPESSRQAKGTALANVLKLGEGEKISAFFRLKNLMTRAVFCMATAEGLIKNTLLSALTNPGRAVSSPLPWIRATCWFPPKSPMEKRNYHGHPFRARASASRKTGEGSGSGG